MRKITRNRQTSAVSAVVLIAVFCVAVLAIAGLKTKPAMAADGMAISEDTASEEIVELTIPDMQYAAGMARGVTAGVEADFDAALHDAVRQGDPSENGALDREEETPSESEYANLAIAQVSNYVNVRKEPNTESEIVGKIYNGAVAEIQSTAGEDGEWFQIVSGSVEGYIKAEYFVYGDAAAEVAENYVTHYAVVDADRLNVRVEPDISASRIGYADHGEKLRVAQDCGEWIKVQYTADKQGYVAAEYVTVIEEFTYAKSIEEERAEQEAQRALQDREHASEQDTLEILTNLTPPSVTYTSNEELRRSIVDYALQFVGNRYVHGGSSLVTGTDCSGFTCLLYKEFGYSLSRTPSGQYASAGRSISYSEIQPGDIICYSSNGGASCTHVALYIGGGQIVHAANSRRGVCVGDALYDNIIGIRNVID